MKPVCYLPQVTLSAGTTTGVRQSMIGRPCSQRPVATRDNQNTYNFPSDEAPPDWFAVTLSDDILAIYPNQVTLIAAQVTTGDRHCMTESPCSKRIIAGTQILSFGFHEGAPLIGNISLC